MADHKSAEKRHKQSLKKRERNQTTKAACRTAIKSTRAAVEQGDAETAQTLLNKAQKAVATAAAKGMYHKKSASRKISRLAKAVARASA